MADETITTRKIAEKTGIKHIALIHSVERNLEALKKVGRFKPLLIDYKTSGRTGKEYLLDIRQEKLLLLLSNNGCPAVVEAKIEAVMSMPEGDEHEQGD